MTDQPTKYVMIIDHDAVNIRGVTQKVQELYLSAMSIPAFTLKNAIQIATAVVCEEKVKLASDPNPQSIPQIDLVIIGCINNERSQLKEAIPALQNFLPKVPIIDIGESLTGGVENANLAMNRKFRDKIIEAFGITRSDDEIPQRDPTYEELMTEISPPSEKTVPVKKQVPSARKTYRKLLKTSFCIDHLRHLYGDHGVRNVVKVFRRILPEQNGVANDAALTLALKIKGSNHENWKGIGPKLMRIILDYAKMAGLMPRKQK